VTFQQSATDADNRSVATIGALYVQDQIEFTPQIMAVLGLRYDRFDVDFRNDRNGTTLDNTDDLFSPRVGLIYKPVDNLSLYASYGVAYVPRAGAQLSSLNVNNAALDPEEFRNYEVGAKWDVNPNLSLTSAVFQLDRSNVAVPDPNDPTRSVLVDGQRTKGIELGASGKITEAWSVFGGYAYQDAKITETQSATVLAGAKLAGVPEHTFSLWNKYDIDRQWGLGLGIIHQTGMYASTSNAVKLDGYTRFDAAVYYQVTENVRAQVNIENILDKDYFVNANSDNNITPGSPRAVYFTLTTNF
jgi:catecholate siderophore receptor